MALTQQHSKWAPPAPTIRVAVLGLLAAFLLLLPLALAPRAEAYIYWAGCESSCTLPGIGRANLDGTNANGSFMTGTFTLTQGIAVDAKHIYWTSWLGPGQGSIGRANLDGTNANGSFITDTGHQTQGIAVDANHIYWTAGSPPVIARANLDGSGVDRSFITMSDHLGIYERSGVAVDAHHVYWTQIQAPNGSIGIGRANLDGTNVDRSFITGLSQPTDVAVDAEHIYWTATGRPPWSVGRAELDGTDVEPAFIPTSGSPKDVAVDAQHVYWAQIEGSCPSGCYGSIGRANLDGTVADADLLGPLEELAVRGGLAVDDLTDTKLAGKASAKKIQRQRGKRIRVAVKVKAKEQLTAKASGKIRINPTYKLKPKKVKLAAGKTRTLRLKPGKKAAGKIARALKRGETAKARLTVKLTDLAGNRETERFTVRLKR